MNETILQNFTQALLKGQKDEARGYLKAYLMLNKSSVMLYDELIKSALYFVGTQWEYNKISTVREHLATSMAESLISELALENLFVEKNKFSVVLACVQNEEHQVGLKMVSNIFESRGWDSYFLGANTFSNEIFSFIQDIKPNVVGISATIYFQMPALLKVVNEIRKQNSEIVILIGGQALKNREIRIFDAMENLFYMNNLSDIELFITKYEEQWELKNY